MHVAYLLIGENLHLQLRETEKDALQALDNLIACNVGLPPDEFKRMGPAAYWNYLEVTVDSVSRILGTKYRWGVSEVTDLPITINTQEYAYES